nr:MAG TPA_asm: hypothetical protein [Caudoviricetes sp.]
MLIPLPLMLSASMETWPEGWPLAVSPPKDSCCSRSWVSEFRQRCCLKRKAR